MFKKKTRKTAAAPKRVVRLSARVFKAVPRAATAPLHTPKILAPKPAFVRETPHGMLNVFPKTLQSEAKKAARHITAETSTNTTRKDFRKIPTCTIDPENAQDFDDALSLVPLKNGMFELGVHIADVSHFVTFDSPIDREAQLRGTSVYLVDQTIPMLPPELSNDLCSLKPNLDRLTFSAVFTIEKNGTVHDTWFGKSIIHSRKRFTYAEAQRVLDTGKGPLYKELINIQKIARALKASRIRAGAIEFGSEEVRFVLDSQGEPIKAEIKPFYETMSMIEECMLLANKHVAQHIVEYVKKNRDQVGVYRIHEAPNGDKLYNFEALVHALGYTLRKQNGTVSSKTLEGILQDSKGSPVHDCIALSMLRAMPKAVYDYRNTGHFGLGFTHYTHFTSPIRRYPDIMVHRILQASLTKKRIDAREVSTYKQLVTRNTQQEISAQEAERNSIKEMHVRYWTPRLGEVCTGTIAGVIPHGIFVRDSATHAEGFIHISKLSTYGYVSFNPKTLSLEDGADTFRLGDPVRFAFIIAHTERNQLEAALV